MLVQVSSCLFLLKYLKVSHLLIQFDSALIMTTSRQEDYTNLWRFPFGIHTGVNLSLLSKVMSSRLSRGTYNGGLLSTEAGTLARVVADGTITLAGYLGESRLLNITLLPSLVICISSILATCYTYNSLYWFIKCHCPPILFPMPIPQTLLSFLLYS